MANDARISELDAALLDPNTLSRLACPACLGSLSVPPSETPDRLACARCGRTYPVVDGIPLLIAEQAEKQK